VFRANVCVLSLLKRPDDLLGNYWWWRDSTQ